MLCQHNIIITISPLEGCGGPVGTDFQQFLPKENVEVFTSFHPFPVWEVVLVFK